MIMFWIVYVFLGVLTLVATVLNQPLIACLCIVAAVVFSISYIFLKTKSKSNDTDDDGDTYTNKNGLNTSVIGGPVQNYQDNTWDTENISKKATLIPNAIDIGGMDSAFDGYNL